MAQQATRSSFERGLLFPHETLYVGIDVGKSRHVAGFLSRSLLKRHERFEGCPTLAFAQSREGFQVLLERFRELVPLEQVVVLLEHTGHYHRLLEQYLLDLDITVYRIHVQERPKGMLKTDKRDALGLANRLYSQLELGAQVVDKMQLVRQALPPTKAASQLKGLIQHRYELSHQSTQLKNKLTAICDELFPEFTQVFRDPNREIALAFREKFPTPAPLALASTAALQELRPRSFPSDAQLLTLQRLAAETIGSKDGDRQRGLLLEQSLLIKELRIVEEHLQILHTTITEIVSHSREGQILLSIPPIGPIQAATVIATIGNIANFERACELKSYFGWAPHRSQTGVSFDRSRLARRGVRPMKQMLFLIAAQATRCECEWARIYRRLLPRLATYDERIHRVCELLLACCGTEEGQSPFGMISEGATSGGNQGEAGPMQQSEREIATGGQDLRGVVSPKTGTVFLEGDIANVMGVIFDAPMAANQGEQVGWGSLLRREIGDEIDDLGRGLPVLSNDASHLRHLSHEGPSGGQVGGEFGADANKAMFHPSAATIPGLGLLANRLRIGKIGGEVSIQRRLVELDGENTRPSLLMNHLHESRMRVQGIRRRDPPRDGEAGQHGFGHRNLIRLLADAHLKERFLTVVGLKRQQMRSLLLPRAGAAQRLAIQRDGVIGCRLQGRLHPTPYHLFERLHIQLG